MKENNKLIAEFMGRCGKEYPDMYWVNIEDTTWTTIDNMKFHKSWDWLMPVVEKIALMQWTWVQIIPDVLGKFPAKSSCYIETGVSRVDFKVSTEESTLIDATYKAVVEFIKWYNENK